MPWLLLIVAGVFEIIWAVGLKYSNGFTKMWPSLGTAAAMILSFVFLAQALKSIPLGMAYAIWTGIGAAGTAVLGMALFGEPATTARIFCLALIIGGIAGLRLTAAA